MRRHVEFERVLCPVDFSEFSRRAFDHALGLARCYGSTVTALHVVSPVPVAVPGARYFGQEEHSRIAPAAADRDTAAAEVERFVASEALPGVRVDVLVQEAPEVYREILAQADRLDSDLIVMGTHGRSGFERLFLGSSAEKVLRTARRPVMTVPPAAPEAMPRGPVPFTRILCAIDFSECSKVALDYAASLAREAGAVLTLLHVVEVIPLYYDFTPPAVVDLTAWADEAGARLRDWVPEAVRSSCSVKEVVANGKPYREILALAAQGAGDLIVMGVQGRNAADMFFFGSTTHHVVREARCAVLTLRA